MTFKQDEMHLELTLIEFMSVQTVTQQYINWLWANTSGCDNQLTQRFSSSTFTRNLP